MIPALRAGDTVKLVAFCDVDFKSYSVDKNLEAFPGVRQFTDFRVMLNAIATKHFNFFLRFKGLAAKGYCRF